MLVFKWRSRGRSYVISIFQISIPKFTAVPRGEARRNGKGEGRGWGWGRRKEQSIYADPRFARRCLRFPVSKLLSHILDNWPVCTPSPPSRHLSSPRQQPSPFGETASSSGYNIALRRPRRYGKNRFIVLYCFRSSSFVTSDPPERRKSEFTRIK